MFRALERVGSVFLGLDERATQPENEINERERL
jgi:hypothetical protein